MGDKHFEFILSESIILPSYLIDISLGLKAVGGFFVSLVL